MEIENLKVKLTWKRNLLQRNMKGFSRTYTEGNYYQSENMNDINIDI